MKEAKLPPQISVLTEHVQSWNGLSQVDDVGGVGELVEDGVVCVQWQVAELGAIGHFLRG